MTTVDTEIEPPGLPQTEDDGPSEHTVVHVLVGELDGTRRASYGAVRGVAADLALADVLIACLRGCAATRGPGLVQAVERHLSTPAPGPGPLVLDPSSSTDAAALARVVLAIPEHQSVKPGDVEHGRRLMQRLMEARATG